MENLDLNS
jgi:hypothetical protein